MQIPLPPSLCTQRNWTGLALYAYFSGLENPTASLYNFDPENPHNLICHLETDNTSLELHSYRSTGHELKWLEDGGFIWLTYIPRKWFQDQLNGCSHLLDASFASDRAGLYAKICGFRPVYQHDGENEVGPSRADSSMQDAHHERLEGAEGPNKPKDKGKQVQE